MVLGPKLPLAARMSSGLSHAVPYKQGYAVPLRETTALYPYHHHPLNPTFLQPFGYANSRAEYSKLDLGTTDSASNKSEKKMQNQEGSGTTRCGPSRPPFSPLSSVSAYSLSTFSVNTHHHPVSFSNRISDLLNSTTPVESPMRTLWPERPKVPPFNPLLMTLTQPKTSFRKSVPARRRTPERNPEEARAKAKVAHKIAERERRSHLKKIFAQLDALLPRPDPSRSRNEILIEAAIQLDNLTALHSRLQLELDFLYHHSQTLAK